MNFEALRNLRYIWQLILFQQSLTENALLPSDDLTWNGKNEGIRRSCRDRV